MGIVIKGLGSATGTQEWYRNPLFAKAVYTEGVKMVADGGAAWLVTDILAQVCCNPKLRDEPFLAIDWTCQLGDKPAKVEYSDGDGMVLETQRYEFTDLENRSIKFFYTDGCLMLSSEY